MNGMEHAEDTTYVPPLVDTRVLMQFCTAIQSYADSAGFHDDAAVKLSRLRARLTNLQSVASLCRLAVLGQQMSFDRLKDELHCIAVDFPGDPLGSESDGADDEDEPDTRYQLAAVIDLLAGAAFVAAGDQDLRDLLIVGIIRAVEDAICYPLAFCNEAAAYIGQGDGTLAMPHAALVIANATRRLIESDYKCDPGVPLDIRARLEQLALKWMRANPVTEMFRAITGPALDSIVGAIDPDDAQTGDTVTLWLKADCARFVPQATNQTATPGTPMTAAGMALPTPAAPSSKTFTSNIFVMFSPLEPAKVLEWASDSVQVQVPVRARTGPVAILRKPDVSDVTYLLQRYACEYPVEWFYSLFSFIPMWKWAYPVALGPPSIEIAETPQSVRIGVFTSSGQVSPNAPVPAGQPVVIQYQVDPPGSDANVPLEVNAPAGQVQRPVQPGTIVYTPSQRDGFVELNWGDLHQSIPIVVNRSGPPAGQQQRQSAQTSTPQSQSQSPPGRGPGARDE